MEDVHSLKEGQTKAVIAVKIAPDLIDIYVIESKAFYYFNFKIT